MINRNIDYQHPNTVWSKIKDDLEGKIISGVFTTAERIPSIAEISKLYGVSKTTAQKALEAMYDDGDIIKQKGVGYFVKPFTKEKLREKHMQEIERLIDVCVSYAHKLGMTQEELIQKITEKMSSCPHGEDEKQ